MSDSLYLLNVSSLEYVYLGKIIAAEDEHATFETTVHFRNKEELLLRLERFMVSSVCQPLAMLTSAEMAEVQDCIGPDKFEEIYLYSSFLDDAATMPNLREISHDRGKELLSKIRLFRGEETE